MGRYIVRKLDRHRKMYRCLICKRYHGWSNTARMMDHILTTHKRMLRSCARVRLYARGECSATDDLMEFVNEHGDDDELAERTWEQMRHSCAGLDEYDGAQQHGFVHTCHDAASCSCHPPLACDGGDSDGYIEVADVPCADCGRTGPAHDAQCCTVRAGRPAAAGGHTSPRSGQGIAPRRDHVRVVVVGGDDSVAEAESAADCDASTSQMPDETSGDALDEARRLALGGDLRCFMRVYGTQARITGPESPAVQQQQEQEQEEEHAPPPAAALFAGYCDARTIGRRRGRKRLSPCTVSPPATPTVATAPTAHCSVLSTEQQ